MTTTTPEAPWWVRFFDDRYRTCDLDRQTDDRTAAQVACVEDVLGHPHDARVLDLCCGTGRHAVRLAQDGYRVTGADLNEDYLRRTRERADRAGVSVRLIHADMRDLSGLDVAGFDSVISLYTSFGFFPGTDGDFATLTQITRVLRPGGTLVLDVINRDWLLRTFAPSDFAAEEDRYVIRDYDDTGGEVVLHEDAFRPTDSTHRWSITRVGDPDGPVVADYRVYSVHELLALIGRAGLHPRRVLGGYAGEPFTIFSPRIIVVADTHA